MDDQSFPKAYEAKRYEDAIYTDWEESGFFNPDNLPGAREKTFSMVLPPPNVTGVLHVGHATMLAIEDIMTRYHRMAGYKTLWVPGTDHAAIATQAKVDKLLRQDGMEDPRRELGREAFLERVDAFAQESQNTIINQSKKMGASMDWSRLAFTLDEPRSKAVKTVFQMMFDDGLIYQGDRVINWCTHCRSTLADDEVEHEEGTATLYTFKYRKDIPITISTTRPETKVGDTAIAVHPDDARYQDTVGKTFEVTFAGADLNLMVVADKEVASDFGTGALGVTPAHSMTDSEIAKRHKLPSLQVIGEDGRMTNTAGTLVAGKTTLEAREAVVAWLTENNLLVSEEESPQNLSVCYRCGTAVEPLPKLQWFIDVNKPFAFRQSTRSPIEGLENGQTLSLKELMQHVVRTKQVQIIPERFEKTYFHWIDNLRDWNISRQIWYGHRVPVWYKGDVIQVGEEPEGDGWEQDSDTLDTWFSAGLWTFSTLGWPDEENEVDRFHPTAVLETGYDILFFWVARMILMTTYVLGEVPFKDVYLHGLVRDEQGRKMSKSIGNVIDPLDTIRDYGADATRLSLVIGTTPGNDIKISKEKVAGFRNFSNKLWNISRFVLTTVEQIERVPQDQLDPQTLADRWILARLSRVAEEVTAHIKGYEFSMAGEKLREFTWSEFADWYVEIAKTQRKDGLASTTDAILLHTLEAVLALWHPFMPFVTEAIWKRFDGTEPLLIHRWPEQVGGEETREDMNQFQRLQSVVSAIRNVRAQYKIDPGQPLPVQYFTDDLVDQQLLDGSQSIIHSLARVDHLMQQSTETPPSGSVPIVIGSLRLFIPLEGVVDVEKERNRIETEIKDVETYIQSLDHKLNNQAFLQNAPRKVVDEMKNKQEAARKTHAALKEQYNVFSS